MPRRFFRRLSIKQETARERWYLAPFANLLHDRDLWGIRRRSVVPAFSIGLFAAFLPFPGHPLVAALLALAFRVNVPIAALTTFVSNPITIGPMYFLAYRVGLQLLGMEPQPLDFELSLRWITESFVAIWQPLMLGCLLLGACSAMLGYLALDTIWRVSIADYLAKRRERRRSRL